MQPATAPPARTIPSPSPPPQQGGWELGKYRLSKNCAVRVISDSPMTSKDVDKLIAHLELAKDSLEEDGGLGAEEDRA